MEGFYISIHFLWIIKNKWTHKTTSANNQRDLRPCLETWEEFSLQQASRRSVLLKCCHSHKSKNFTSFISTSDLGSWKALWRIENWKYWNPNIFLSGNKSLSTSEACLICFFGILVEKLFLTNLSKYLYVCLCKNALFLKEKKKKRSRIWWAQNVRALHSRIWNCWPPCLHTDFGSDIPKGSNVPPFFFFFLFNKEIFYSTFLVWIKGKGSMDKGMVMC